MGKNVFLTGSAGTGKTYVLNEYITWLKQHGIEVAITASTGIAATHLGGQTIHSWSGIGIKNTLSIYDLDHIEQNEKLVKRFRKTKVLIIDEVSMLHAHTLEMINQAVQAGTQSYEPFAGMQVVLCGDFFQLPPVSHSPEDVSFAFESVAWKDLRLNICYLHEQFRQHDEKLLGILNAIRSGEESYTICNLLKERIGITAEGSVPHLYTHNVDVDALNNEKLSALEGHPHLYTMKTKGRKGKIEILKNNLLVPETLFLKKGAVVMFVKNHPYGLYANGTLGTVVRFSKNYPVIKTHAGEELEVEPETWKIEDGAKVLAEVSQIPLRLAWAVTIHKSQGITLDAAYMDLRKTFVSGQGYVALSRVRSFSGLYIQGIHEYAFVQNHRIAHKDRYFQEASLRTERRLEITDTSRIKKISDEFILHSGGHEPTKESLSTHTDARKESTYEKTHVLLKKKLDIQDIAKVRKISQGTVMHHIEKLLEKEHLSKNNLTYIRKRHPEQEESLEEIACAFAQKETWNLTPVHKHLSEKYSFDALRFARLFLRPWGKE